MTSIYGEFFRPFVSGVLPEHPGGNSDILMPTIDG